MGPKFSVWLGYVMSSFYMLCLSCFVWLGCIVSSFYTLYLSCFDFQKQRKCSHNSEGKDKSHFYESKVEYLTALRVRLAS